MTKPTLDPSLARFHGRLSRSCLTVVAVAAGLTTLGWLVDSDLLQELFGGWPTGLGEGLAFLGIAIAALALREPKLVGTRAAAMAIGATVAVLSAVVFVLDLLDRSPNLEPLHDATPIAAGTEMPALLLSAGLCFAGLAVLVLAWSRGWAGPLGDLLAALPAAIGELIVLGYATGVFELQADADTTGAPLYVAAFLFATSVGLLFMFPTAGAAARFSSAGPDGLLVRRLTVLALLVPVGLAVVTWLDGGDDGGNGTAGWLYAASAVAMFFVGLWFGAGALSRR